jgi:hypothetical protein
MEKAKKRTIKTIIFMSIFAIAVIGIYFYMSRRTDPLKEASVKDLSEVEKILQKDLKLYYPETPREVVKLFGNMMKVLYSDLEDQEVEALALKIRELYDQEFIDNNPQDVYLTNLYSEIAKWKDEDRRITNYVLNNDAAETGEIDEKEYAAVKISFTIQENIKSIQTWRVLLRLDENEKWKILGWEVLSEDK